jgi:hypothetical protein
VIITALTVLSGLILTVCTTIELNWNLFMDFTTPERRVRVRGLLRFAEDAAILLLLLMSVFLVIGEKGWLSMSLFALIATGGVALTYLLVRHCRHVAEKAEPSAQLLSG